MPLPPSPRRLALLSSILWLALAATPASAQGLRVLFIGNSYTYYNNLPGIVADFARTAQNGREVAVEMVARGGATLRDHWMAGEALAAIRRGRWDFVVLQEQSMLGVMLVDGAPSVNDPEFFHTYARLFAREIVAAGAKPVFYLTWARKATPVLQGRLTNAYLAIARETGAVLAPAGIAWQGVRTERPDLALYDPDGTHPSPAGSYLAAATIWASISGAPTRGLRPAARGRLLTDSQNVRLTDTVGTLVTLRDGDAALIQRHVDKAIADVPRLSATTPRDARPSPLPAGAPLALKSLAGRWTGTMRLYDAPVAVELSVTPSPRGVDAVWRVRGEGWNAEQSLRDVSVDGAVLTFTLPDPRFLAPAERHRAVLVGDRLVGRAEVGSATQVPRLVGSWTLVRAAGRP